MFILLLKLMSGLDETAAGHNGSSYQRGALLTSDIVAVDFTLAKDRSARNSLASNTHSRARHDRAGSFLLDVSGPSKPFVPVPCWKVSDRNLKAGDYLYAQGAYLDHNISGS